MNLDRALEVLGFQNVQGMTFSSLKLKYKSVAKDRHPDKMGGSSKEFVELRKAFLFLNEYLQEHPEVLGRDDIVPTNTDQNILDSLTKEELIEKYIHDTRELELRSTGSNELVTKQSTIFDSLGAQITELVEAFEASKKTIERDFHAEVDRIESRVKPGIGNAVLFWRAKSPQEAKDDLVVLKQLYERKFMELDLKFHNDMLQIYGDGLHRISESVESE